MSSELKHFRRRMARSSSSDLQRLFVTSLRIRPVLSPDCSWLHTTPSDSSAASLHSTAEPEEKSILLHRSKTNSASRVHTIIREARPSSGRSSAEFRAISCSHAFCSNRRCRSHSTRTMLCASSPRLRYPITPMSPLIPPAISTLSGNRWRRSIRSALIGFRMVRIQIITSRLQRSCIG